MNNIHNMNNIIVRSDLKAIKQEPTAITSEQYERFIQFLEVSPKSVETYRKTLLQFFKWLGSEGITHPTRLDLLNFRTWLNEKNKPTTVQIYMISVRLFFQWTAQEDIYPNIADKIKGAKVSKAHKKDYLTPNQVKDIMNDIEQSDIKGVRDYALFALMVTGGLRTIEVARANIEDLRTVGTEMALFLQGKGKEDRTEFVKLPYQTEKAIRKYLIMRENVDPKSPLFLSTSNRNTAGRMTTRAISGIVKERMREAGIDSERLTAHSLRHTAATLSLLNGCSIDETQQFLRHANIQSTLVYAHHLDRAKNTASKKVAKAIF